MQENNWLSITGNFSPFASYNCTNFLLKETALREYMTNCSMTCSRALQCISVVLQR